MGDNPTTATDAHTVSSTKARLAVCATKIIARLPVTVIVRLLKMFQPLQKSSSIQQALAVDAKVREVSPLCRGGAGVPGTVHLNLPFAFSHAPESGVGLRVPGETVPSARMGHRRGGTH